MKSIYLSRILRYSFPYIALSASELFAQFMVAGWPDEDMFNACIDDIISRARQNSTKVRAFGEMVALLWAEGKNGATVQLEALWNKLHEKDSFTLYCAYPKTGFTQSPTDSLQTICRAHAKTIEGAASGGNLIYYRTD